MKNLLRMKSFYLSFRLPVTATILVVCCLSLFHSSFAQQWNVLGSEGQISTVASAYTSITVVDKVPYIVYVEGTTSGIAKVKRRNISTGAWEQVGGNVATVASFTKIYSDKAGKLYVTYIDGSAGSKLAVVTFNTTTLAWGPLATGSLYASTGTANHSVSGFSSTPRSGLAFDNNNVPYVTFSERSSGNNKPYVKRFLNEAWATVGTSSVSTDSAVANNIALDNNDVPYVVYIKQALATSSIGTVKTFRFNSTTNVWEDVSPPNPVAPGSSTTGATNNARHTSIAMDSTYNPIVSFFNASNSSKSTLIRFNKATSTWNYVGTTSTRDAPLSTLIKDNGGNTYNMFTDALISGGLSNMVRVVKLPRGAGAFMELKNSSSSRGIDSTGDNSTVARSVSIADLGIAVGSDTSQPFIVYTKTISGGSFRTPIVQVFTQPVVTNTVTNVTSNSATAAGDISNFGETVLEKGIVYSANANPTTSDNKIADGSGSVVYSVSLTGLIPATTYNVRAYAITPSGTIYGNNVSFYTPAPDANSVTVTEDATTVVLSNGIVKATIRKADGSIPSIIYNGIELVTGGHGGGNFYWSWSMPDYQNPEGCTYTITADPHTNNFNFAEIKLHMAWNGSASTAAMDMDIYYSLPKGASGIYATATLSHPAAYPALTGGEWRIVGYPNPRFDRLNVDSLRNGILLPTDEEWENGENVPGAPLEVKRILNGPTMDHYECKYDYSADFGETDVWGWSSTQDKVGLWMTAPSKEYYPGGPMKRELTGHAGPILLNMLGGTHYGQGGATSVAAGEEWKKTCGPFLIYCNKVDAGTANASMALWKDAKVQVRKEQEAWPYSWHTNPDYVKESGRGMVTGKLVINSTGASAANMWVGLAQMPVGSTDVTQFQTWSKNYQFWVKTDAVGNFTIPKVLPGTYNLYAFGPGAAGQLTRTNLATVTAGNTINLDTVQWTPDRLAPTIWEIGMPDRSAAEFRHGSDYWTSDQYPSSNWGRFMSFLDEFPNNELNYTIGTSNPATDWNFIMPYEKARQSSSPKWNVNFTLPTAPTAGSMASLYGAFAGANSCALIMTVNGVNVTVPSTGVSFTYTSQVMYRKGIHSAFNERRITFPASYLKAGNNTITFTLRLTGSNSWGEVLFDYLRLEGTIPECTMPNLILSPKDTITSTRTTGCDTVVNYTVEATGYPTPSLTYTFTGATIGSGDGTGSGSLFNKGTTKVAIAATNKCGTTNYSFNVTVNDSISPVITAPSNIQLSTNNDCTATGVALGSPIIADNCSSIDKLIVTNDAPASFSQGATIVTWTVKDEAGNMSTATQQVKVVDDVKPTITAPADVTLNADANQCIASNVLLGSPQTVDNCSVASVMSDAPAFYPVGTTTVTWTVTDASGNHQTATQTVTVTDDQKPVLAVPADQNFCYNNSESYTVPSLSATDNCGVASVNYSITGATQRGGPGVDASGNFNIGISTITWTVTDVHNNQSTRSTTITVNAPFAASIADVYAVSQTKDNMNTLYTGYGPSSFILTATPTNGIAPFAYKWNVGQTTSSINVNSADTYLATLTDAQGCTATASKTIMVLDVTCGNNTDKVMICHNGVMICVASTAVQAHLNHGDNLGSCPSKTSTVVSGTEALELNVSGISVYPNPSTGQFTVQLNGLKATTATVVIMDLNEKVIERKVVTIMGGSQLMKFSLANHSQGVYIIKVVGADGVKIAKVVVQK